MSADDVMRLAHVTSTNTVIKWFACVLQSQEGAALIDVQTTALFGNLRDLQTQMQNAVGQDATSIEELMQKVQVTPLMYPSCTLDLPLMHPLLQLLTVATVCTGMHAASR